MRATLPARAAIYAAALVLVAVCLFPFLWMVVSSVKELRELYMEMKPYMPILSSFKNPDFKIRHYEIIEKDH